MDKSKVALFWPTLHKRTKCNERMVPIKIANQQIR